MMHTRWRWSGVGGLVLVIALLLAACGTQAPSTGGTGEQTGGGTATEATSAPAASGGEASGATSAPAASGGEASGEPIKIGAIFDQTGATADVGAPYGQGVQAFVAWKNANGGINGRPIDLISADYAYEVPQAEQLYTQYVTQDKVVAFSGWGTGDTEALKGKISQDKIPFISGSFSEELADPSQTPYNFLVAPTYSDQLIVAQKWALEDWQQKGQSGTPKFAYLINDSPFGRSPVSAGEEHAQANGLEKPLTVPIPRGTTDMTPLLTQIKDYGANYVFIQNVSSPAAQAIKDAQTQGLKDQLQFVCLNWCANELLIQQAGDAANGVVGIIPFAPVSSGAEGAQQAVDYAKENNIDVAGKEIPYVQGWWAMAILVEGIERAAEQGQELTGESIKAALESMKDFETGGVTAPVSFSESDHRATNQVRVYQVKDGQWEPITDFLTAE